MHLRTFWVSAAALLAIVPSGAAQAAADYPALKVEGAFDNAQTHATSVENPTAEMPIVVMGGDRKEKENQAIALRHQHKYMTFHVKVSGIAGRAVRFRFGPFAAGGAQVQTLKTPVVYYDIAHKDFEIVQDVRVERIFLGSREEDRAKADYWGDVLEFTHRFRQDAAYVALTFPLTTDDLAAFAKELSTRPGCTVASIGKSRLDALPIWQIVVTDPNVPDAGKKGVWLYAGEDPWEFPGNIACLGAARWAASEDPLASEFRKGFILSCVPIVHPDCVRRGQTNYALDNEYKDFLNFSRSWGRTDIPEMDAVRAAVRKWKEAGRPLDYSESMHSSLSWGCMIRQDYGDGNEGKRFVEAVIGKKFMPWFGYQTAGKQYADLAEKTGFVAFLKTVYPGALGMISHTEQILLLGDKAPGFDLPPFPAWEKKTWTDEDSRNMRGRMIPMQWEDIEAWGAYRMLALMEFYGKKIDPARVPAQLICGLLDGYATKAGAKRTFSVVYRDVEGRAPKGVKLFLADGTEKEMTRSAGNSPLYAIRFEASIVVAKGRKYDFHFTADNGTAQVRYPRQGKFPGPYAAEDK